MDRRAFLVATAGLVGSLALPAGAVNGSPRILAVFDRRYGEARRFARAVEALGGGSVAAQEDVARLWYGPVGPAVRAGALRVAGLTTYADFQVMRGCAAEARLDLAFHAVHDGRNSTTIAHRVATAGGFPGIDAQLAGAGAGWPATLACALCGGGQGEPGRAVSTRRAADNPGVLVSWLIA